MSKLFKYGIASSVLGIISFLLFTGFSDTRSPEEFQIGTIHVGSVVSDLDASVDFYTNVLGMTESGSFTASDVADGFAENSGLSGGVPFEVTVLKLKQGDATTDWKLISFNREANHPWPEYIQDDTGVQYITILVTSLDPFLERIRANGIELLGNTPITLGDGRSFALIQDPDGTFIELVGPAE